MGRSKPQYTEVAAKAVNFADMFNAVFRDGMAGPLPYRLEITEPAGPSTEGGRQALQHIRLLPEGGGPAIVVGSANQVDKSAELRTHYLLADLHARRFSGAPFPLDAQQYRELLDRLQRFFAAERFRVVMMDATSSMAPPRPQPQSSGAIVVVAMLALLAAVAVATYLVLR